MRLWVWRGFGDKDSVEWKQEGDTNGGNTVSMYKILKEMKLYF